MPALLRYAGAPPAAAGGVIAAGGAAGSAQQQGAGRGGGGLDLVISGACQSGVPGCQIAPTAG